MLGQEVTLLYKDRGIEMNVISCLQQWISILVHEYCEEMTGRELASFMISSKYQQKVSSQAKLSVTYHSQLAEQILEIFFGEVSGFYYINRGVARIPEDVI